MANTDYALIISDIQNKIHWPVKATSFEGFNSIFRPDKDQIEILPEKKEIIV